MKRSILAIILGFIFSHASSAAEDKFDLPRSISKAPTIESKCGSLQIQEAITSKDIVSSTIKLRVVNSTNESSLKFDIVGKPIQNGYSRDTLVWSPSCKFLLIRWSYLVDVENKRISFLPKLINNNFFPFDDKKNVALDDFGKYLGMSGFLNRVDGRVAYWDLKTGLKVLDVPTKRTAVNDINIYFEPNSTIVHHNSVSFDLSKVLPSNEVAIENQLRKAKYSNWELANTINLDGENSNKKLFFRPDGNQIALARTAQFEKPSLQLLDLKTNNVTDVLSDLFPNNEVKRLGTPQYSRDNKTLVAPITNKKSNLPPQYGTSDFQFAPKTHLIVIDSVTKNANLFPLEVGVKADSSDLGCKSFDLQFLISPNGRNIAYTSCDGKLYFMDANNGQSQYQMEMPNAKEMKYSDDGKYLAISWYTKPSYDNANRLTVFELNTDGSSKIVLNVEHEIIGSDRSLNWLGQGNIAVGGRGSRNKIRLYNIESGKLTNETEYTGEFYKTISDDKFLTLENSIDLFEYSVQSGKLDQTSFKGIIRFDNYTYLSKNNNYLIHRNVQWGLLVADASSGQVLQYLSHEETGGMQDQIVLSDDEKTLAVLVSGKDDINKILFYSLPMP